MCALNRLVNGKVNNFYERIFEIYKLGGGLVDGRVNIQKVE